MIDPWIARKATRTLSSGRRIAWVEKEGHGPSVLLIHGFTDSSRSFSLLEPMLPGWHLLMPDLMGHGESGRPADGYGLDSLADDLRGLMSELGYCPDLIVGHSLGAMVALKLVAGMDAKPPSLVLLSGSARPRLDRNPLLVDWIRNIPHPVDPQDRFFDSWYEASDKVPEAFLRQMRFEAASIPSVVWQRVLLALSDADLSEEVKRLTQPVLSIAGSDDRIFDSCHRNHLRQLLPSGHHITMLGVGHNPHWDAPHEVANFIAGFASLLAQ